MPKDKIDIQVADLGKEVKKRGLKKPKKKIKVIKDGT